MAHVRAQIREYVRALLASIPGLEQACTIDRNEITAEAELPKVLVSIGDEDIDQSGLGGPMGRKNIRSLLMTTDVICKDRKEPILEAEEYAAKIEAKLARDPRLNRLVTDLRLRAYTITSEEGSTPILQLRLQWFVTYSTNERDATVSV